jgi:diguanylate cyclase (GGDEF)-like protein
VIAGLLLAAGIAIWLLRLGAIADTQDENRRIGVMLAEQVTRSLQTVDLILEEMADKVAAGGAQDPDSMRALVSGRDVNVALARRTVNLPQTDAIAFVDADGYLVNNSGGWPVPHLSVRERSYFRYLANTADPKPYLSEAVFGVVSGRKTAFLARRLTAPNGAFLGIVLAAIRLDFFAEIFADAGFKTGENVTFLRRDGQVLLRFPLKDLPLSTRMPADSPWFKVVASGGGYYHSAGALAGNGPGYVSVNPLALYPVVVDIVRSDTDSLARWRTQAGFIGLSALAASIILALLLRALSRQITLIERSQHQIARQVRAIRANEACLAAQSDLLQTTLDHMNQGLLMVDATGHVRLWNQRVIDLLDLPPEWMAVYPRLVDLIEFREHSDRLAGHTVAQLDPSISLSSQATYERRRPNGTVIEVRSAPLGDGGMVRTYTDITARSVAEDMLVLAASHDQLTGAANRNGFNRGLDAALSVSQRNNTALTVLCLDLDRFKAVNDTFGHTAGDQLLVMVTQRIRSVARASDLIGRLGGDEFAVLLPGADRAGAETMCERLLEAIRPPYELDGQLARIGVSIGAAIFPTDGLTAEQLLSNADTALYRAKAAGRNTWCVYISGDGEREIERMQLEQDFRSALEAQSFTLAFQPICNSLSREPVAFEALCRWDHPSHGPVSPTVFIPIAETTGLIIPLGRWVIETACAEAAGWALPLDIAVNLSPAQFRDAGLLGGVEQALQRSRLAPSRLHLEVTEGLLLDESDDTLNTMHALREMGIRLVLDDFGVAHSNLSYLRGLPFDAVKIDRSFLRALNTDRQARALVEAILAMARALGIDVIGEGVETPEQLALLCHLQCRLVQGFHLGHPAPGAATRSWITRLAAEGVSRHRPLIG